MYYVRVWNSYSQSHKDIHANTKKHTTNLICVLCCILANETHTSQTQWETKNEKMKKHW